MASPIRTALRVRDDENDTFVKILLRIGSSLLLFGGMAQLYVGYVSVYFAYYGFSYAFLPARLPMALLAVGTLSLFVRPRISEISALTSALCHLFFLIPTAVMFVYAGLFPSIFAWAALIQTSLILVSRMNVRVRFHTGLPLPLVMRGLAAIAAIGLALVIYVNGIFSLNFNIYEVYERRAQANVTDLGAFGYLEQMGAQAALLLTAVAFHNRKWLMTLAGFGIAVLFFAYTGHKSTVFWALFLVALVYVGRYRHKFVYLLSASTAFVWLTAAAINTSAGEQVANFLIRRTLFTPVLLNQYYFMFARQFGFLEWSYSKIGLGLFEYNDTISPTQAVGFYLTGSDENSANTGMIGSGFLNSGHLGVAFYLATFLVILTLSAGLARQKRIEMLGAAVMIRSTYFAVTTSDLPSIVLSGGLGYAFLLLLLYPAASEGTSPSERDSLPRDRMLAPMPSIGD